MSTQINKTPDYQRVIKALEIIDQRNDWDDMYEHGTAELRLKFFLTEQEASMLYNLIQVRTNTKYRFSDQTPAAIFEMLVESTHNNFEGWSPVEKLIIEAFLADIAFGASHVEPALDIPKPQTQPQTQPEQWEPETQSLEPPTPKPYLPQFKETNVRSITARADELLSCIEEMGLTTSKEKALVDAVLKDNPDMETDPWEYAAWFLVSIELMERRIRVEDPTCASNSLNNPFNGGF